MNNSEITRTVDDSSAENFSRLNRRKLLLLLGIGGVAASTLPNRWSKPIIDAVVLPAHAQTSCVADTVVGGPLAGHPSGAATCQAACESEATTLGAQLCSVTESTDALGATQCTCNIDSP